MRWRILIVMVITICSTDPHLRAETFYHNDFNGGSAGALALQSNWQLTDTGGVDQSAAIRLTYAKKGTPGNQAILNVEPYDTQELWIEFDARIEGPMNGGMKFVKIFGEFGDDKANNSTFIMNYQANTLSAIMFKYDSLCALRLDGTNNRPDACVYTPVKTTPPIDLRGNVWRRVKIHFVRAAAGENTGSYRMWVDGVEKFHFVDVNNNSPVDRATSRIKAVSFGDYTASNDATWYFWIDNLTISDEETPVPGPDPNPDPKPPEAVIQWQAPVYTADEQDGTIEVAILRSGDATEPATAKWGTFQGTANVDEDYVGVAWTTVTFGAGERSKTVSITLVDDELPEGNEIFTLSLSDPGSCMLGPQVNAQVIIVDNDGGGTAPVASFTCDPTPASGPAPFTLNCTDTSGGEPVSWQWDFDGDGQTDATGQTTGYTYANDGEYSLSMTAGNAFGEDTALMAVSVAAPADDSEEGDIDEDSTPGEGGGGDTDSSSGCFLSIFH